MKKSFFIGPLKIAEMSDAELPNLVSIHRPRRRF